MRRHGIGTVAGLAICAVAAAGCGRSTDAMALIDPGDGGNYAPAIDPAAFVAVIDNPYLPLVRGSRWIYERRSDGEAERTEVVVTDQRHTVMGVDITVVRDTVTVNGDLVEDTLDWFAQDRDGTVWYFGEESKDYEDGTLAGTEGSWTAGVNGALPGIVMPARPAVGFAYRQEFAEGEAEDMGEVVRVGQRASVPSGRYEDVVVTRDWNPLEPDTIEEKYYAPGVGLVLETETAPDQDRAELIEYTKGTGK